MTGPVVAWLMSFPNSGRSYTLRGISAASRTSVVTNYGYECLPSSPFSPAPSQGIGETSCGMADEILQQWDVLHPEGCIGRLENVGRHQLRVRVPPKLLLLILPLLRERQDQWWRG